MNPNPETVLMVVLHKVGTLSIDETEFSRALNNASKNDVFFKRFRVRPGYHFSRTMDQALDMLVLGGLIGRGGRIGYFTVMPGLVEEGKVEFDKLTATEKEAVKKVAKLVRDYCRVET